MKKLFIIVLYGCLIGCNSPVKETEETLPPLETPPSYLSFRINFPITEIEEGVNRVLPLTLFDDVVPMKDPKDSLFLKVYRKGALKMTYKNGEVLASIPLKVNAAVKKNVLGMTFSNKDTPVEFEGKLEASAQIEITDNWDLSVACLYRNFDLGDQATFSVMGMTFNVEKTINSALENHTDELSNIICSAINQSIDFRQVMTNLWYDIQSPLRIAQNPQPMWLKSDPIALNGKLMPMDDILSIHMEYRTSIQISSDKMKSNIPKELPMRGEPLNTKNQLVTYPDVRLPYSDLSKILNDTFQDQTFEYEGYRVKVNGVKVGHIGQKLAVDLDVSGDIIGTVKVSGTPVLSDVQELSLSNFKFEIKSDDEMLNMADWAVNTFARDYLSEKVKVDTKPFLDQLDELIKEGISKEIDTNKISVDFEIDKISSYQTRLTDEYIQWIFSVEGQAALTLKNGLFKAQ
ncbi:MAG: DUF4403 family protein [Marinoscillum sp.]